MSELKPCPFCGGNAELGGDDAHEYAVVYCEECGNSTDGYLVAECGYHHASEAWNKRTTEEALTEINRLQLEENKQLAEDNAKLREALQGLVAVVGESTGVCGYHLNGDIAEWDEFGEVAVALQLLESMK